MVQQRTSSIPADIAELIVEESPIGHFVVTNGELRYFNDGLANIHKHTPAEIEAMGSLLAAVHPDDLERVSQLVAQKIYEERRPSPDSTPDHRRQW